MLTAMFTGQPKRRPSFAMHAGASQILHGFKGFSSTLWKAGASEPARPSWMGIGRFPFGSSRLPFLLVGCGGSETEWFGALS